MQLNQDLAGMEQKQKDILNVSRISFKTLDKVQLTQCACERDTNRERRMDATDTATVSQGDRQSNTPGWMDRQIDRQTQRQGEKKNERKSEFKRYIERERERDLCLSSCSSL